MHDKGHMMLHHNKENGFVLVGVMLMLLVLAFIGITATTTSNIELQIAGNDKAYKQTFYKADAGIEVGSRMVEENVSCPNGFTSNVGADTADTPSVLAGSAIIKGQIVVERTSAADMTPRDYWQTSISPAVVSDAARDMYYPQNYGNGPHTNITIGGPTVYAAGSAIQMVSGYEGKGKGAAAGGAMINYTIIAQGQGMLNSASEVEILWRHIIGLEGDCNY